MRQTFCSVADQLLNRVTLTDAAKGNGVEKRVDNCGGLSLRSVRAHRLSTRARGPGLCYSSIFLVIEITKEIGLRISS